MSTSRWTAVQHLDTGVKVRKVSAKTGEAQMLSEVCFESKTSFTKYYALQQAIPSKNQGKRKKEAVND
jgi:hypothetical protein